MFGIASLRRAQRRSRLNAFRYNRWTVAVAGTVMMMCLGTVYSWSLFARPLIATFHWSATTTMWGFSLAIFTLGLGAIVGGRWQDRVGPRSVAACGVFLWALGNVLAGLFTPQLGAWWLYLTYGIVGGFGLGMGYVSPVAMVTKWFPDRRGLASGLVLTGFGLGAFVYNLVVPLFPAFRAMNAGDVHALMGAFVWSGLAYVVVGGFCTLLMTDPPAGFGRRRSDPVLVVAKNYTPREVLRTPQFYMLWSMLFFSVTAGILVISNAVPIFSDLTGAGAALAAPVVGILAVFNGIGRVLWGGISDRIGRNLAFILILGIQAVVFAAMPWLHGVGALSLAFALVLLCNGGSFGTLPAFNADYFGTKYMGYNYGLLITAWGCAGVVGPELAARVKDVTGSYVATLVPVALMLLAATALPAIVRRPGDTSPIVEYVRRKIAERIPATRDGEAA